jgi:hypothetical protein
MGHLFQSAAIMHGHGLFLTISPNERHSCLTLRLSRFRQGDPLLGMSSDTERRKRFASADAPSLFLDHQSGFTTDGTDAIDIDLPGFDFRREILCRDPLAPVAVRLILASLLGRRMCTKCPACRCCNSFGSNARPTGGIFGLCAALVGAVENQFLGTLHYHALAFLVNIYQFATLQDIEQAIGEGRLFADAVKEWHCWVSREEHFDVAWHTESEDKLYQGWKSGFSGPEHGALCALPQYLTRADDAPTLWTGGVSEGEANAEGAAFRRRYFADAQGVFSRVHHHWHPDGQPLTSCLTKQQKSKRRKAGVKKAPGACKHGFPKSGLICDKARVVCPGLARRLRDSGVSVRGRRNALGAILGRRNDAWLSGNELEIMTPPIHCNADSSCVLLTLRFFSTHSKLVIQVPISSRRWKSMISDSFAARLQHLL